MIKPKTERTFRPAWQVQKAKLKVRFPQLTDSDLEYDETKKNEMLAKLRDVLGKSTKELKFILDTL